MNVVSAFDGGSCGQIALNKSSISYDDYFASEIDKHAISVTQHNYPNTTQLGDITKVKGRNLPKIDLLIGGSPCQGFSFSGKGLNFDDPRSKLFFEFVRLLNELNPKYFLLENVLMKKEYENVITEHLGVQPHYFNSSKFSAQDRKRLYWTNIPVINKKEDSGIYLIDILDKEVPDSYYLKEEFASRYVPTEKYELNKNKSCVIGKLSKYQGDRVFDVMGKASSLSASGGNNGGGGCNIIIDPKNNRLRRLTPTECEKLQTIPVNYTSVVRNSERYKILGNGWTVDLISHILKGII